MTHNRAEYQNVPSETFHQNPVFENDFNEKTSTPGLTDSLLLKANEPLISEEVLINVSSEDDPTTLCLTFRSCLLAILLTCFVAVGNQFFAFRTSPLDINAGIVILISYMLGQFMAYLLPTHLFNGILNPGPFSIKEHALVTMMATSGSFVSSVIEIITTQRIYYNYHLSHLTAILFSITILWTILAVAGLSQRFLIWPVAMVWPKSLMSCALIRTLAHEEVSTSSAWTMSRSKFFWWTVLGQFIWFWLPGYIFPLLSFFSVLCFFAPEKIVWSQITGANGLGFGAFEFDWNAWVAYLDSPILVPFWAHVNWFVGFIMAVWFFTPLIYYTNTWNTQTFPIVYNRVFDGSGRFFNTTRPTSSLLNINGTKNDDIANEMFLTAGYAVSCTFVFAGVGALISHITLYHGKFLRDQFRATLADTKNDVHAKLMSHYAQVPDWCYAILLLIAFVSGSIICLVQQWMGPLMLLLAILIGTALLLPSGIIMALTSISTIMGIPSEVISGILLHGNPLGFLCFRSFSFVLQKQGMIYLTSYKTAHYMKIPPRIAAGALLLGTIITSIVHYFTADYLLNNVRNICTAKNPQWRCLYVEATYTVSTIWSVYGVSKTFGLQSRYAIIPFCFFLGLLLPMISWGLWKRFPHIRWLGLINFPIILLSTNSFPPAPAAEFSSWFIAGFIFNFILYRYAHNWWEKYAYIFSAGMSCGVVIAGMIIFVLLQNNGISFPQWWGLGGPTGDGCPLDIANYSGSIPIDFDR